MVENRSVWLPLDRLDYDGPLLIDTHIWIWYLDGAESFLTEATVHLLRRCMRGGGLVVSDISVWEVGTKAAKGKLMLSPSVSTWLDRAYTLPGFSFLPLDRDVLLESTRLPGEPHGDPADRMLIASSVLAALPLVTADHSIIDYAPTQGAFSVCDARG